MAADHDRLRDLWEVYRPDRLTSTADDLDRVVEAREELAEAVPALLDENDRLQGLRDDIARAVRGDTFDVLQDFGRLPQEIKSQHEDASDAADYVGVVYGLVHKLRGELPDGEDEHPGTWLENWVDSTLAENDRLREEGVPGVMHAVDRAFHDLTVQQRDHAWTENQRLTRERDHAAVEALASLLTEFDEQYAELKDCYLRATDPAERADFSSKLDGFGWCRDRFREAARRAAR